MNALTAFPFRSMLGPLVAILSFPMALHADPTLPKLAPQDGLGVNIHFTYPQPGELEMIAAAGFKWVRMDFIWSRTEMEKGKYDFAEYDHLLAELDKQKLHAILILDYGNPLYADTNDTQPFTSRAGMEPFRTAYAAWAAAAVKHFEGRGCLWEIWNEPNFKNFWAPAPNVAEYIALAKAAAAAIHAVAPNEPLIGPGSSTIDFGFLEACLEGGLLEDWVAVSVHPYRRKDPETVTAEYQRLRNMITEYSPPGKMIPIISSEWGYSTGWPGYDERKQADCLTRELSTNIADGIPISIWYDWRDDGDSGGDPEHRFGLVHRLYHPGRNPVYDPKPAYEAMKAFAEKLRHPAASAAE